MKYPRPASTPVERESSELRWWQKFAELENRFSWVQTPEMQNILRGPYVEQILRATPPGGRILELGCGVGWLCLALARFGAREVHGIDFSAAQIDIARAAAEASGLSDRVHFECADGTTTEPLDEPFDCVVVHGFLHHLDQNEIRRTVLGLPNLLRPDGVCIVFEPVRHTVMAGAETPTPLWDRQRRLQQAAESGRTSMSAEEVYWRGLMAERPVGVAPHGPSPKEVPFTAGELESYMHMRFRVTSKSTSMVAAHLVVQDWLLRSVTDPEFVAPRLTRIAKIAARLDRLMAEREEYPDGAWVFMMFVCRLAPRSSLLDEIDGFRARKKELETSSSVLSRGTQVPEVTLV